ncbi:protocadherin gamma-B5-like isoform X9 [Ambystoma mexicanum]|uniref:protocadherin gamma-B5-like isoform X9 n=1 Tax=Ambystoma mexicanum TaxID=8296 RepID=UPI0037E9174D
MMAGVCPGGAALRGRRQVLLSLLCCCCVCAAVSAQIQYSIPEEMKRGSIVGNLAKDLGISTTQLPDRKLRIDSVSGNQYFTLNADTGTLHVSDRIDREQMCGEDASCAIKFEAIVENPLNVFHVDIFIQDVNDNTPSFLKNPIDLEIAESTLPGARISLGNARDPDIDINALQGYTLSPNPHFILKQNVLRDGYKSVELLLEKALDREKESHHHLILTAYDGGDPVRSSTVDINIKVLDANDNFPVFTQETYRAAISEGAANNSLVLQVRATDSDEGSNARVTYSFSSIADSALNTFSLNAESGDIKVRRTLDFEKTSSYEIVVEAKDGGGYVSHCRVKIEVFDENDNAPQITFSSITSPVPENSPPDTVVALIKVHDQDSGGNGEVLCNIQEHLPFKLISSSEKYYKLVTVGPMDRETVPEYNITVTATDKGTPPLATSRTIRLQLSDLNDNPPVFEKASYQVYVPENNSPGASIYQLIASDLDLDQNSHVTYSIGNHHIGNIPLSSYISINSQTGVIYAQRSYDYEQLREFEFQVKAQDSGSPPLSSNVTVKVFIVDQNDNPPEILYPALGPDGSVLFEMVPPSSDPGYLITKVVAVDRDSGHNAWLSYHLLHALESPLFRIGLHTGQIRTSRAFLEKDLLKQKVAILVKDNGQPPLSATVTLNMVFTENMHGTLPELSDPPRVDDDHSYLKVYLAVALALISFLFILTLMLVVIIKCRKPKGPKMFESLNPTVYSDIDPRFKSNYQNGTLPLPYSYEVAVALNSGQNEFTFLKPRKEVSTDILCSANDSGLGNQSPGGTIGNEILKQQAQPFQQSQPFQQAPPNTDWRFSQAQRPGTSGSQNSEEAGGWPNNQFETERLQAMILASANEGADGSSTLGGGAGTMGLSTRYGPQFTLQHVPDYRQNVYIPGSTATLTNAAGKRDGKSAAASGGNKKKSGKKEKK